MYSVVPSPCETRPCNNMLLRKKAHDFLRELYSRLSDFLYKFPHQMEAIFFYPTRAQGIIVIWTLRDNPNESKKSSGHGDREASLPRLPGQ